MSNLRKSKTRQGRRALKALKRRREHLAQRVRERPEWSYDKAEIAALAWAVETVESYERELVEAGLLSRSDEGEA